MPDKTITLTAFELESLIKKATKEAVVETLSALGINMEEPVEMQRDFVWLRNWRENSDAAARTSLLAVVTMIVSGLGGLVYMAFHK